MSIEIRTATVEDLDQIVGLMMLDAAARSAQNPEFWVVDAEAETKIRSTLQAAMENTNPPFRQQWLLAVEGQDVVGVAHSILLPVPPIYAGEHGAPGLIMEDSCVAANAPAGTDQALLAAAEADLRAAGAKILLTTSVVGGAWEAVIAASDYKPVTNYFSKTDLVSADSDAEIRMAGEADLAAIVASSAQHRLILEALNPLFWKPHPEADARFGSWMARSMTLPDRDMFVAEAEGIFEGYAISQPATPLHLPPAHDAGRIGIIDDFHHIDLDDPATLVDDGHSAAALLARAEAARKDRGNAAILVVCPAAWDSKIALLQAAGYSNAITWFIKS
ncbi:hypothetical protein [Phaeobacter sp. J2-8]|uniref:hypothetical protein n=1 Tax=Phaeobacter sp. J2-8 TaxID=2931394 RepID=UPI001FD0A681|nr:hypothetical protein [Phaeobacter sp. J2-8]MCJ7872258.1 hypothetical protein [Phaeobacter sp. J2-8]